MPLVRITSDMIARRSASLACGASLASGLAIGLVLLLESASIWLVAMALALGSVPGAVWVFGASIPAAVAPDSEAARDLLAVLRSARELPWIERVLATLFVSSAFLYIQLVSDYAPDYVSALAAAAPVAIATILFGLMFGLASAFGVGTADYFIFVPPRFTIWFENWRDLQGVAIFLVTAICAAVIFHAAYRVSEETLG